MNPYVLILGMTLVTFIPRLLPALFYDRFKFPAWFQKWLELIPYAALGALIFPGILKVAPEQPALGWMGGLTAVLLAILNIHLTLVMAGAVTVVLLINFIIY